MPDIPTTIWIDIKPDILNSLLGNWVDLSVLPINDNYARLGLKYYSADSVERLKKALRRTAQCTCPDAGRYGHWDNELCHLTIACRALAETDNSQGEEK